MAGHAVAVCKERVIGVSGLARVGLRKGGAECTVD